jgi:homoserine O-acetyltransferase
VRHEFVIRDFRTRSGVVLPEARVVYSTLGTLNASGDNAILLPSHYMANFNGYNWLIRGADPNRVFDPARDFLILTELFGNGRSSSPSNTPEPFHGPALPGYDDPRQRRRRLSLVTTGTARQAFARRRRILDGCRSRRFSGR